jgi:hypothetical protein
MTLPLARTNAEAHLYMELHPCQTCGEGDFEPRSSVVFVDGDLASHYTGRCRGCGAAREFTFRIPQDVVLPDLEHPAFGEEQVSQLLDPGEWLWLADVIARKTPAEPTGLSHDERRNARIDLRTAAAALDEAVKFVPEGADAVPGTACWSERGSQVYSDEPGRFRRIRLEAVARAYRDLAERFTD